MYILSFPTPVPSGFPMNLSAVTLSSSEIMVNWTTFPEIDHNGILTSYEVQYNQTVANDSHPPSASVSVSSSEMSVILKDLGALVTYTITVRACTRIGCGPYNPCPVTAQTDPDGRHAKCLFTTPFNCISLSPIVPERPPAPPPPILPPEPPLPPEEPIVTVTLLITAPEVTGGNITNYFVVLEAIGIRNSTATRRKRQIEGTLENCTMTGVSNNFTVSPNTTELNVTASMFNGNAICSIAHYDSFFQLHSQYMSIKYRLPMI